MWRLLGVLLMATSAFADRSYVQHLLDTDLTGDALYAAYDEHYDALSRADKVKEKAMYPREVYNELLAHRLNKFAPKFAPKVDKIPRRPNVNDKIYLKTP